MKRKPNSKRRSKAKIIRFFLECNLTLNRKIVLCTSTWIYFLAFSGNTFLLSLLEDISSKLLWRNMLRFCEKIFTVRIYKSSKKSSLVRTLLCIFENTSFENHFGEDLLLSFVRCLGWEELLISGEIFLGQKI